MKTARQHFDVLIQPLRDIARARGYALAVHGSLNRDIDLVAIPWVHTTIDPPELAEALRLEAERINGWCQAHQIEHEDPFHRAGCPGMKDHRRLVWSFHLSGEVYIDLSVVARSPEFTIKEIVALTDAQRVPA